MSKRKNNQNNLLKVNIFAELGWTNIFLSIHLTITPFRTELFYLQLFNLGKFKLPTEIKESDIKKGIQLGRGGFADVFRLDILIQI